MANKDSEKFSDYDTFDDIRGSDGAFDIDGGMRLHSAFDEAAGEMQAAPIVIDPDDGMPRPKDDFFPGATAVELTHDNLICMEGKDWKLSGYPFAGDAATAIVHVGHDVTFLGWFNAGAGVVVGPMEKNGRVDARAACAQVSLTDADLRDLRVPWHVVKQVSAGRDGQPMCVVMLSDMERLPGKVGKLAAEVAKAIRAKDLWYAKQAAFGLEPLRPRCAHYRRILSTTQGDSSVTAMFRWCDRVRSASGSPLVLTDEAIFACEFREPRDRESDALLAERDFVQLRRNSRAKETDDQGLPVTNSLE